MVSWFGTEISGIALPLIVLSITGSPAQAGSIAAMRGLLYVLLAIPAGGLIDRWDRKKIMVIANLGSGLAMGSIAVSLFLHVLTIPQLYITGFIEGGCFVFANLCRFAITPLVVTREELPSAASKMGIADFSALSVGPALGGILYQTFGATFSFVIDSFSYFINAFSIFFITVPLNVVREKKESLTKEIHEGILWFLNQPLIRFVNITTCGITLLSVGVYLLVIVMARQFNASAGIIGIVLGVGAVGGIIGSIVAPWIQNRLSFRKSLIGTTIAFAIIFGLYIFVHNVVFLALITGFLSMTGAVYDIIGYSKMAPMIPDEIRGRVNSLTRTTVLGSYSLGYFLMGISLQYLGITRTIIVFFCFLCILAFSVIANKAVKQA